MKDKLLDISKKAIEELSNIESLTELEAIRIKYLGKKGELTAILRGMGALSPEERPVVGKVANEVRAKIEAEIENISREIKEKEKSKRLKSEVIDISLPGKKPVIGKRHPLELTIQGMKDIYEQVIAAL